MIDADFTPPVIRRSRRTVFSNRVMTLYADHVVGANGVSVVDYAVLSPNGVHERRIAGVTVLPVREGCVTLMRVYRHPMDSWFWEAPRGMVDAGETPAVAARRELTEETGLRCPPGALLPLGTYVPDNATLIARGGLFAARDCVADGRRLDNEIGLGELRSFTLDEALDLAGNSEIEDSSTLIALYRYARAFSDPATVGRGL